jgi:hypothetical protein
LKVNALNTWHVACQLHIEEKAFTRICKIKAVFGQECYLASTAIAAVVVWAFVGDSGLTVGAGKARWTGTGVRPLAGVETGSAVHARLIAGAVVQVLKLKNNNNRCFVHV